MDTADQLASATRALLRADLATLSYDEIEAELAALQRARRFALARLEARTPARARLYSAAVWA
jgi:hypothetical protein